MTSPYAASSPRTGFGKWKKWTASPSEGARRPGLVSGLCLGPAQRVTQLLTLPTRRLQLLLPDSLTTWEIHGVSLSKSTGGVTLLGPWGSCFQAPWT